MLAHLGLAVVEVHADDLVSARKLQALDDVEANTTETEDHAA